MNSSVRYKSIVILADAGIGDFIWATSALSLIRDYDKEIRITLITTNLAVELIDKKLGIDYVITTNHKYYASANIFKRLIYKFYWCIKNYRKIHNIDACLILDASLFFVLAAKYFYGIKHIIGPDNFSFGVNVKNKDSKYYTRIVPLPVDTDRTSCAVRYQILIRAIFPTYNLSLPKLPDSYYLSEKVSALLGKTRKYKIALCTAGSVKWKYWDLNYFKAVISKLNDILDATFFIVGNSEQELEKGNYLCESLPDVDIRNLCKKTTLLELKELFNSTDLLISVDTACIHIASVTKTHIIALYGPALPESSMPISHKASLMCSYRECSPCIGKRILYGYKCDDPKCMYDIIPEQVVKKAKTALGIL